MLIRCDECGQKVSDKASACPHCGAPVQRFREGKSVDVAPPDSDERSIVCPQCGSGYGIGEIRCPRCGYVNAVLGRRFAEKQRSPGANKHSWSRICPDCGYEYDLFAEHCPKCGSMNIPVVILGAIGSIVATIIVFAVIFKGC